MTKPIIDINSSRRNTLVLCPIGLGNFIMATPAMQTLSTALGREHLHILALKPGVKTMAQESGWFSGIHYWDPDSEPLLKGLRLLMQLRKKKFNYSISIFPSSHWKFCLFARLINAKTKIGFKYGHTVIPVLIQDHSPDLDLSAHDSEQNLNLIQYSLGLEPSRPDKLRYTPAARSTPELRDALNDHSYFVCHPGSSALRSMLRKRLPASKFSALIDNICSRFNLKCVLLGGPEEAGLREEIKGRAGNVFLDTIPQNLNELGYVIQQARFFLGNDSGLMHMAVALEKKCIAFFGPSDEVRTGPYFLSEDTNDASPSRGHLVIRHENAGNGPDKRKHSVNPRLRNRDSNGLQLLDVNKAWEKMEPFIREILLP